MPIHNQGVLNIIHFLPVEMRENINRERVGEILGSLSTKESRALEKASENTDPLIRELPPYQQAWVSLWELCQSQRYGQGMCIGTLVHSEVWNNLERLDFTGQLKLRAFRVVVATDEIFRDFAIKAQDKKNKRGSKPDGLSGIKNQLDSVEGKRA